MRIDILTLFPEMFSSVFSCGLIKRAILKEAVRITLHNIRQFSTDKHRKVDDYPYGGGPGMILKPEPIFKAIESLLPGFVILLSPQGRTFTWEVARELSLEDHLILVCGHYGGVDERIKSLIDLELSVGNYILSGGELPAMVVVDATVRWIPGVLGNPLSLEDSLISYPQYTRPREYRGLKVPDVLLSGNHKEIERWRKEMSQGRRLKDE